MNYIQQFSTPMDKAYESQRFNLHHFLLHRDVQMDYEDQTCNLSVHTRTSFN